MIQTVEVHLDLILGTMQGVCGFALSVDGRVPVPQSGLWQWQHHHGVSVPWTCWGNWWMLCCWSRLVHFKRRNVVLLLLLLLPVLVVWYKQSPCQYRNPSKWRLHTLNCFPSGGLDTSCLMLRLSNVTCLGSEWWMGREKSAHAFSQHTVTIGSGRCTEPWHANLSPMVAEILEGPPWLDCVRFFDVASRTCKNGISVFSFVTSSLLEGQDGQGKSYQQRMIWYDRIWQNDIWSK